MRLSPTLLFVALVASGTSVALTGCDDADSGSGFSGSDGVAQPPSGVWNYQDGGVQENTCGDGLDLTRDPDTSFLLTYNDDGTFTVDQGQAGEDFDCTISADNTFSCPSRLYNMETITEINATVTWNVSITGEFISDREMEGSQRADITCEGAGCALAPMAGVTVPCYYTVDFTAKAR